MQLSQPEEITTNTIARISLPVSHVARPRAGAWKDVLLPHVVSLGFRVRGLGFTFFKVRGCKCILEAAGSPPRIFDFG